MSIASEITRLQGVKSDILTAIADKGVTVPAGSMLDDCPDLIASISSGGLPGDFGEGAGLLPTGYRQVAAVYIPNNSATNAAIAMKLSDYGLPNFDTTGMKVKCAFWGPSPDISFGNTVDFFRIYKYGNISNVSKSSLSSLWCRNGGGDAFANFPGGTLAGLHDVELNGSNVFFDGQTIKNNLPVTAFEAETIQPFIFYRASYVVGTCDLATRYLKIYNNNSSLSFYFVPVVRESDSVPGLYELVNDIFIGNNYSVAIDTIED